MADETGADKPGTDTSGTDTSGTDTSGTDTSGTDTSGTDTSGTDTSGTGPSEPVEPEVGVGPHREPWPDDPRLDPELLAEGDRRNVEDRFRYWRRQAIIDQLDTERHPFHVAIENWEHDFNIGSVVRNANAFGATAVHIVGRRRWNRRGAMVTDRYQHVEHHPTIADLVTWSAQQGLPIIGIDNTPGSVPIEQVSLPQRCVLLFGQEGPGLSAEAQDAASSVFAVTQFGSTRSVNAGVASGIAMFAWVLQHVHGWTAPHGA